MTPPRTGIACVAMAVLAGSCVAPAAPRAVIAAPPPVAASPAPALAPPSGPIGITGTARQGGLLWGSLEPGTAALTLDGQPVRVATDGRFVIGFGRDAPPIAILRATLANGHPTELRLTVAPRAWPTETIAGLPRFAQPPAEYAARRPAELAQINAARRVNADSDGWRQRFAWPVTGRISGRFGSQRVYANGEKGDPHSGVDIARPTGTPVAAPADGVVVLAAAAPFTLEGNLLMIDHGMGLNSAFLHLSRIDVHVGDHVRQGQRVGTIGMTGRASGPHLHWAMKWTDRRIDPQLVAGQQ